MTNLTGNIYGRLSVVSLSRKVQRIVKGKKQGFIYFYNCSCECGVVKEVAMNHLKAGKTVSCGCLRKESSTAALESWTKEYRISKGVNPEENMTEQSRIDRVLFKPVGREVLERDGFRCVWCSESGKVHAHHIEKWSDNKDRRFDKTNLVTLCKVCHYKVHNNGRYHTAPDPIMSILLAGYSAEIEAICMRVEKT